MITLKLSAKEMMMNTRPFTVHGLLSFLVFSFLFAMLADSLYQDAPVRLISTGAHVDYIKAVPVLEVSHKFERLTRQDVELHSWLYSTTDKTIVPLFEGKLGKDLTDFKKSFVVPDGLRGRWCLDGEIVYSYRLSITKHRITLEDKCFELKDPT
jgi:hypothetical protein